MRATRFNTAMVFGWAAACQLLNTSPATAQASRASISIQLGQPSSGPASDIEQAVRANGFGDDSPSFSGPPIANPFSDTGFASIGFPVVFEFDYRVHAPWSVGVLVAHTPIGDTLGYNRTANESVDVQYAVTTIAALVTRNYGALTIGAGPAVHVARTRGTDVGFNEGQASRDSASSPVAA